MMTDVGAAISAVADYGLARLRADVVKVRERVDAHQLDLRDVGVLLTGKWDQDFVVALLDAVDALIVTPDVVGIIARLHELGSIPEVLDKLGRIKGLEETER